MSIAESGALLVLATQIVNLLIAVVTLVFILRIHRRT